MPCGGRRGVALTVTMVIIVVLVLLASFTVNYGYNKKRLVDINSGRRDTLNFRAEAGVVDANWRIRSNYTVGLSPAGSFATDAYDPAPYGLDVDKNGVTDTCVNIGPVTNVNTGQRSIVSTGIEEGGVCT